MSSANVGSCSDNGSPPMSEGLDQAFQIDLNLSPDLYGPSCLVVPKVLWYKPFGESRHH